MAALAKTSSLKTQKTSAQLCEDRKTIMVALAEMACYRATVAPEYYLSAFSKRLAYEHLPGVLASLARLGEMPRKDGETALPDLGTILKNRPIRDSWE